MSQRLQRLRGLRVSHVERRPEQPGLRVETRFIEDLAQNSRRVAALRLDEHNLQVRAVEYDERDRSILRRIASDARAGIPLLAAKPLSLEDPLHHRRPRARA